MGQMDWNNDGKHDWKDDSIFHNVIDSDSGKNKPPSNQPSSHSGCSGWISTLVALGYLGLLLPGDIPINGFTMYIGLICAGILAVKFFGWLYR